MQAWSQSAGKADGVEVGTRGFVGGSPTRLLLDLGLLGQGQHKTAREVSREAAKARKTLDPTAKNTLLQASEPQSDMIK